MYHSGIDRWIIGSLVFRQICEKIITLIQNIVPQRLVGISIFLLPRCRQSFNHYWNR